MDIDPGVVAVVGSLLAVYGISLAWSFFKELL